MENLYYKQLTVHHYLHEKNEIILFDFQRLKARLVEISSNSPEIGKVEEQIQAESH